MVPATTSLIGFSGETIWPLGQLRLLVTIGDADHATKAKRNFMIVRSLSPYNGKHCPTSEFPGSRSGNRRDAIRERTDETMLTPEGISWIYSHGSQSDMKEIKRPGPGTCQSHPSGGTKTSRGGDHERSLLSRLAVQSSHGEKAGYRQCTRNNACGICVLDMILRREAFGYVCEVDTETFVRRVMTLGDTKLECNVLNWRLRRISVLE
ncbi:hypothetical protein Tco_0196384 [Tanacetum coccineum]